MTNNVNVSLDTSVTPHALKVHDHGHIKVGKKPTAQTITWNLTGNLAQGNFVSMSAPDPGFEWIDPPPAAGIFGTPTIGSNGNSLSISDSHVDRTTDGRWIYRLRVFLDGSVYSTIVDPGITSTSKNPIIIND